MYVNYMSSSVYYNTCTDKREPNFSLYWVQRSIQKMYNHQLYEWGVRLDRDNVPYCHNQVTLVMPPRSVSVLWGRVTDWADMNGRIPTCWTMQCIVIHIMI
jgi:hypothetical protein